MRFIRKFVFIFSAFLIFSSTPVNATSVSIKVESTEVGNIIFDVDLLNGRDAHDGVLFYLYVVKDGKYSKVSSSQTKNGLLIFENIPFGEYLVKVSENSGYYGYKRVILDMNFVKNQHIAKKLLISDDENIIPDNDSSLDNNYSSTSVTTGVVEKPLFWVSMITASSLLGILLYKRRCTSEDR